MSRRGHGSSSNLEAYAVVRQFNHHDEEAAVVKFMMLFSGQGRVVGMVKRALKNLLDSTDLKVLHFDACLRCLRLGLDGSSGL